VQLLYLVEGDRPIIAHTCRAAIGDHPDHRRGRAARQGRQARTTAAGRPAWMAMWPAADPWRRRKAGGVPRAIGHVRRFLTHPGEHGQYLIRPHGWPRHAHARRRDEHRRRSSERDHAELLRPRVVRATECQERLRSITHTGKRAREWRAIRVAGTISTLTN